MKERIKNLTDQLNKANHQYYVLDDPQMPDFEYDKLFDEFTKILNRNLTKEEKKIIDLAYKMGKTNQFLTEATVYKKR